ncbi:MAG: hypothetical protein P8Y36_10730, partial [Alphaproteobacteria bacterium]
MALLFVWSQSITGKVVRYEHRRLISFDFLAHHVSVQDMRQGYPWHFPLQEGLRPLIKQATFAVIGILLGVGRKSLI